VKVLEGGGTERGVLVGSARRDFLHSRLSLFYNRNLPSCTLSLFTLSSSIVVPDLVTRLHVGVSVPTYVPLMPLPVNCMKPEVNMISASTSGTDYVVFNVIVDSGCSSHTFNSLTYIDNYKVMIEEDHSSMVLADRSRVQIRGKGSCGVLGDVYYVPEIRNCLLSVRQMDRQGVTTTFSDGLCEMRDRATGKVVLHCRIQEMNGLYTLSQEQFEEQLGIGHQLCMAHSIRTDPASRLHCIAIESCFGCAM